MDIHRAAKAASESGMIRREHVDDLLRSLKNPTFGWILCDPSRTQERLQGDLFREMPTAFIDPNGQARSKNFTVMLINNACDLQSNRSEFVTLAPIQHFNKFAGDYKAINPQKAKSYLETVQANRIDELLYLPHCAYLPQGGVVRFDLLCSVSASVYEGAIRAGSRLASLTQTGFYFALMKLTHFLARPESSEITREEAAV